MAHAADYQPVLAFALEPNSLTPAGTNPPREEIEDAITLCYELVEFMRIC